MVSDYISWRFPRYACDGCQSLVPLPATLRAEDCSPGSKYPIPPGWIEFKQLHLCESCILTLNNRLISDVHSMLELNPAMDARAYIRTLVAHSSGERPDNPEAQDK